MFYGIPKDKRKEFFRALESMAKIYKGEFYANDNLICFNRILSFRNDQKFRDSFCASASTEQENSLFWRLHVLAWAAQNSLHVDGDFVECGVLKGFCSSVLCKYLDFQNISRCFYLYDTFSGLPQETSTDQERSDWNRAYEGVDSDKLYEYVCQVFAEYPNVTIVRGIVPYIFEKVVPDKIALLHIDMNSEEAETMAPEELFDRVAIGGAIVLDDFGWSCNANQNAAESAFMKKRNHSVLELPTGQGLILKHNEH